MNINGLEKAINDVKFEKHQLLFFTGARKKFVTLMEKLPGCKLISVRDTLVDASEKNEIKWLDEKTTGQLAHELLPRPGPGESVALYDTELFIKYDQFFTTMRSQHFQNRLFLIHIPDRYRDKLHKIDMISTG